MYQDTRIEEKHEIEQHAVVYQTCIAMCIHIAYLFVSTTAISWMFDLA